LIVKDHQLNELAPYLPSFTADGFKLDVLSLSESQSEAVLAWKRAAGPLHAVWAGYERLAKYEGYDLGPVDLDSLWTNRFTAVVLGANNEAQSMTAAQVFVGASANVESARQIRQLIPFVASAIAGFPLQLRSLDEANARIRGFHTMHAPGAVPIGVSF
jgi:hypothetical protein